jgi:hypothetical protein
VSGSAAAEPAERVEERGPEVIGAPPFYVRMLLHTCRDDEPIDGLVYLTHGASTRAATQLAGGVARCDAAVFVAALARTTVHVALTSRAPATGAHKAISALIVDLAAFVAGARAAVHVAAALGVDGAGCAVAVHAGEASWTVFVGLAGAVSVLAGLAHSTPAQGGQTRVAVILVFAGMRQGSIAEFVHDRFGAHLTTKSRVAWADPLSD